MLRILPWRALRSTNRNLILLALAITLLLTICWLNSGKPRLLAAPSVFEDQHDARVSQRWWWWRWWPPPRSTVETHYIGNELAAAITEETDWEWAKDVSVVYTWVNGSEPDLAAERMRFGGPASSGLYRDHDDLRYSLRTWVANAPWHRGKIFIVSPTAPSWLNQSHPRIQWVPQNTILPPDAQPTFSNYVVEQFLYLTPGLSPTHFIHMNDDYMLDRPTTSADFFTAEGGVRLYFDNAFISPDAEVSGGSSWQESLRRTISLLDEAYIGNSTRYRYLKHAPYAYHRAAFPLVHASPAFSSALQRTRQHKFRTPGDVLIPYLHYGFIINIYSIETSGTPSSFAYDYVRDGPGKAFLLMWSTNQSANNEAVTRDLEARKPLFLTVNDDMGVADENAVDAAHQQLLRFYEERYGHLPGIFEDTEGQTHY